MLRLTWKMSASDEGDVDDKFTRGVMFLEPEKRASSDPSDACGRKSRKLERRKSSLTLGGRLNVTVLPVTSSGSNGDVVAEVESGDVQMDDGGHIDKILTSEESPPLTDSGTCLREDSGVSSPTANCNNNSDGDDAELDAIGKCLPVDLKATIDSMIEEKKETLCARGKCDRPFLVNATALALKASIRCGRLTSDQCRLSHPHIMEVLRKTGVKHARDINDQIKLTAQYNLLKDEPLMKKYDSYIEKLWNECDMWDEVEQRITEETAQFLRDNAACLDATVTHIRDNHLPSLHQPPGSTGQGQGHEEKVREMRTRVISEHRKLLEALKLANETRSDILDQLKDKVAAMSTARCSTNSAHHNPHIPSSAAASDQPYSADPLVDFFEAGDRLHALNTKADTQ